MRVEDLVRPAVVTELQNANMAVGRCTGKQTATLMRSPRDHVHRCSVQREIKDLCPSATSNRRGRVLVLLAPDEHLAIVRGGGEDRAEFGMRL